MTYRIVVPKAVGQPFVQTAETASEALTKLAAGRVLFGTDEVYVEAADGTRVEDTQLQRARAIETAPRS